MEPTIANVSQGCDATLLGVDVDAHLCVESGARVVRGHGMVGHRSPGVILGRRLRVPHVSSVPVSTNKQ